MSFEIDFEKPKKKKKLKAKPLVFPSLELHHLSPSAISSFISNRPGFYSGKVLKEPFRPNAGMARGKAVEHGINMWIDSLADGKTELSDEESVEWAMEKYDAEYNEHKFDEAKYQENRETVEGLVECGIEHFRELIDHYGTPDTQSKICIRLDGVDLDIIGYLDFEFGKIIKDTKVYAKSPYCLSDGYIIQGAMYKHARKKDMDFTFLVANKNPVVKTISLTDEEFEFGIRYGTAAGKCIERIIHCTCPKEMMALMSFPDLEKIWDKEEKKSVMKRLFKEYNV